MNGALGQQMVVAIAVIFDNDGRVFLQERIDDETIDADRKWNFPGGQVEFGESPEAAVVRECREEIGCEVVVERLIPIVLSKVWENHDAPPHHTIIVSYVCRIVSGVPRAMIDEVGALGWYRRDEIPALPKLPGVLEVIDAAMPPLL